MNQLALAVLTCSGLLIVSRAKSPRWDLAGWILMLAAQPFWLAATWSAEQYGMFLVSWVYALVAGDAVLCRALLVIRTPRRLR
jgi:hypothetical protein